MHPILIFYLEDVSLTRYTLTRMVGGPIALAVLALAEGFWRRLFSKTCRFFFFFIFVILGIFLIYFYF